MVVVKGEACRKRRSLWRSGSHAMRVVGGRKSEEARLTPPAGLGQALCSCAARHFVCVAVAFTQRCQLGEGGMHEDTDSMRTDIVCRYALFAD